MKKKSPKIKLKGGMPALHDQVVKRLSSGLKPVKSPMSVGRQWLCWLAGISLLAAVFFYRMPLRDDLSGNLANLSFDLMLVLVFGGAAFAAWGAIEASLPAGEGAGKWKFWMAIALWVSAGLLFFFFQPWKAESYLEHGPIPCFVVVFLVGLVSWIVLGALISRNAPLNPRKVGVWSGVSAFLISLGIISLHCSSQNLYHVCFEHFLPVLIYSWLTGWLGYRWFSSWKRKPLPK